MRIKLTTPIAKLQKRAALRLLRKLKAELPPEGICYVSGGAPRDWHHGWGCRDVDIFYHVPNKPNWLPKSFKKLDTTDVYANEYPTRGYIHSVTEYECNSGALKYRPIQFIHTNQDPLGIIQCDFPISLSRIWMGVDGKIFASHEYEISYNHRIIHEESNHTWNYTYLDKILGRYRDYCFMPHGWEGRRTT